MRTWSKSPPPAKAKVEEEAKAEANAVASKRVKSHSSSSFPMEFAPMEPLYQEFSPNTDCEVGKENKEEWENFLNELSGA